MPALPTGTVTFLFSDVEGSTALLQQLGHRYAAMYWMHRQLLRAAFQAAGGHEVDTAGDGFFIAFPRATDAAAAAVAAQRAIATHLGGGRPGSHAPGVAPGEPTLAAGGYVGLDVHRAARICTAGHGGQILLSQTTCDLVAPELPGGREVLRFRGEYEFPVPPRPCPISRVFPRAHRCRSGRQWPSSSSVRWRSSLTSLSPMKTPPPWPRFCIRLNGLPLAIELAAARIRLSTPQAMLARLENRTEAPPLEARETYPHANRPSGARSPGAMTCLDEGERTLFRRLAVFVGGLTLEAAEAGVPLGPSPRDWRRADTGRRGIGWAGVAGRQKPAALSRGAWGGVPLHHVGDDPRVCGGEAGRKWGDGRCGTAACPLLLGAGGGSAAEVTWAAGGVVGDPAGAGAWQPACRVGVVVGKRGSRAGAQVGDGDFAYLLPARISPRGAGVVDAAAGHDGTGGVRFISHRGASADSMRQGGCAFKRDHAQRVRAWKRAWPSGGVW